MTNGEPHSNGSTNGRQNITNTNLFNDTPHTVDLNLWECDLQRLADVRFALETAIHERLTGSDVPHSPAIKQLILVMPSQDRISLLHRDPGFCSGHEELIAGTLEALRDCSEVLAKADSLISRFLRQPSSTNPADIAAGADDMDLALSRLEASYEL